MPVVTPAQEQCGAFLAQHFVVLRRPCPVLFSYHSADCFCHGLSYVPKPADVEAARAILRDAKKREIPILTPADTNLGFDVGPKTVERFTSFLKDAGTIFWNGPLGWFEKPEYAKGTFEVAKFVAALPALKVVGGGDTVSAIKQSGFADRFDHLSTGGGAVLEYIEQGSLPGIDILKVYRQAQSPYLA